jgi:hypothetical protein
VNPVVQPQEPTDVNYTSQQMMHISNQVSFTDLLPQSPYPPIPFVTSNTYVPFGVSASFMTSSTMEQQNRAESFIQDAASNRVLCRPADLRFDVIRRLASEINH